MLFLLMIAIVFYVDNRDFIAVILIHVIDPEIVNKKVQVNCSRTF